MWHSCSNYPLEHHFATRQPAVRATFDRLLEVIALSGESEIIPQKTRIAIQAEVRFISCITRQKWLLANLWLTRRVDHPRVQRVDVLGSTTFIHQFRLDSPADIDAAFTEFVGESYSVGLRRHLRR